MKQNFSSTIHNNDFKLKIEKIDWVINVNWSKSFTDWPSFPDWISGWWCKCHPHLHPNPKPSPRPTPHGNKSLFKHCHFVCMHLMSIQWKFNQDQTVLEDFGYWQRSRITNLSSKSCFYIIQTVHWTLKSS